MLTIPDLSEHEGSRIVVTKVRPSRRRADIDHGFDAPIQGREFREVQSSAARLEWVFCYYGNRRDGVQQSGSMGVRRLSAVCWIIRGNNS